jgi:hypothetical protein
MFTVACCIATLWLGYTVLFAKAVSGIRSLFSSASCDPTETQLAAPMSRAGLPWPRASVSSARAATEIRSAEQILALGVERQKSPASTAARRHRNDQSRALAAKAEQRQQFFQHAPPPARAVVQM